MNEKYKSAFSVVCPSESSVERIFDMTKKKKVTFKPLLIAAIVTTLMAVSVVCANAATDGAIVEKAEQVVENAVQSFKVLINGKEALAENVEYTHSTEMKDGAEFECHNFDIVGENGGNYNVDVEVKDDGDVIYVSAGGDSSANIYIGDADTYIMLEAVGDDEKDEIKIDVPIGEEEAE